MYAKINGGAAIKFPYTFGDLRKDNPNVSFPKNITPGVMQRYGMVAVTDGTKPSTTAYQTVQRNALPTRPVIGQYTADNAPVPEMVGDDIIAGYWQIGYTAVDMFADTTDEEGVTTTKAEHEAAYQATLDAKAAEANRTTRNKLLAETDYFALTDVTMDAAMTSYRQALRDITSHANWPNLDEADWPTKP